MTPSPTQSNVMTALNAFLGNVLPGVVVVAAAGNRVPEPKATSFIVMTPIRFERLETNVDSYADVKFMGSIAGTALTVTAVATGVIQEGATVFGAGVAANTTVVAQVSGPEGGVGVYTISPSQTLATTTLSGGAKTMQQNAKVTVQLDFHSADTTAADMAQAVSTALRDEYGVNFFAGLTPPLNAVVPLYADDPKYMPFTNAEAQYEWRWVLEAALQANQVLSVPQQFADEVAIGVVSVDVAYPP